MPGKAQTTGTALEFDVDGSGGGGGGDATAANQVLEIAELAILNAQVATEAKQDTGNTSLASIDAKLTNPLPISGAVTGPLTDVQLRATPVPVSGTVTVDTSLLATASKQDTGNTSLAQIDTNTDPLLVSGAGGYVRQDSTATIAKESGGNLAIVAEPVDSKADLQRVGSPTTTLSTSNATPITTAATTDVVSAPSSGNHLEITRLHVTNGSTTACKVSFKEASGSEVFHCNLPQYGLMSLDLKSGWHLTTATKLQMVTSAAGSIDYTISHRTVPD